ncbi:hypothetical protein Taro_034511 [Colocasia esculenta]|uniref:Uncharacterized protein n=1 Tax=Colocasia esculenta TaxID=4460 RepID=A0A843VRK3_COLES|nr:hypothetical protein [Colocasia esculenta]
MECFIRGTDFDLWQVIEGGDYVVTPAVGTPAITIADKKFSKVSACVSSKDMWEKLKLTYEGIPTTDEIPTDAQVFKETRQEAISPSSPTVAIQGEQQEAPQEVIFPNEEEDVKDEPQIEREPHIFFKKDVFEEIRIKEASDEDEAEDKAHKIQVTPQETPSVNNSSGNNSKDLTKNMSKVESN